jgi:hypothetical protein
MRTDDRPAVSFAVTDRLVTAPDREAARAIHEAVAAIERTFIGGAEWRAVVGALQLMRRILEEPPRTCKRCGGRFRLEHGAAFALYHRCLPLPKHCADCRAVRRQEGASPATHKRAVEFGNRGG